MRSNSGGSPSGPRPGSPLPRTGRGAGGEGRSPAPDAGKPDEHESLLTRFRDRAEALGVVVGRVADAEAAGRWLAELAASWDATEAVLSHEAAEAAPAVLRALTGAGLLMAAAGEPVATRDAPFGISLAHLAVAETGSVLLAEPTLNDRAIGMLAAAQVVVCRTDRLVPSLDEAAPLLRALATRPGGAYATLVTGPSRTADIERVLTVGVQGPGRVAVLFVDELA